MYNRSVDDPAGKASPSDDTGKSEVRVALPESITAAFDALTVPDGAQASPAPGADAASSTARRPLLTLFPTEPTLGAAPVHRPASKAPASSRPSYESFYGLGESAFALNTDPRFFYHSAPHDEASQRLLTAIREREGLVVLTGPAGAGKTTLCRAVVEQLDRRTLTSLVSEPFASGEELLTRVLADFGVLSPEELAHGSRATARELSTTLQSFIESSLAPLPANAVVIVDDAENVPPRVFDEVRLLCEAADASLHLQVVLAGQPRLATLLREPANKQLQQRVAVRCRLEPLPPDDIAGYINHRLAIAGAGVRVEFDESACAKIHELSGGLPRVVNQLADRSLARGFEATAAVIDAEIVESAARDLDVAAPRPGRPRAVVQLAVALVIALCVSIGAGAAAWVFRDALARSIERWKMKPNPPAEPARRAPTPLKTPAPPDSGVQP